MRERWGVTGWGVVAILLAFSLAGMTTLRVTRPILDLLLPSDPPRWLWWTLRVGIIIPVYEILLISFGTLLGQRHFFWEKQKRLFRLITRWHRRSA